jgi:hypothetical protein
MILQLSLYAVPGRRRGKQATGIVSRVLEIDPAHPSITTQAVPCRVDRHARINQPPGGIT